MIPINHHLKQYTALSAAVLLGIMTCYTLLYSLTEWHSDWMIAHTEIPIHAIQKDEMTDLIAAIPNQHLFGKNFSQNGNMPITNLQLKVTGIVKIDNETEGTISKAYISMEGQPSKIYQVGDNLPYGVKVYAITSDTVILENEGQLEKLPLPRMPLQFKPRSIEEMNNAH